ncbi:MAG: ABC transporter substrate-binding protein [Burkholderiaceae bacterium]|nr:ABC transporter substrate-binding protein [Burkholderiaceae bacterium]
MLFISLLKRPALRATLLALLLAAAAFSASHAQQQPTRGGTLNWALRVEPPTLVPINTSAGGATDIGPKVTEGLLTYDNQLNPKPLLATAWEVAPNGLRYTFKLRKGVKWHDGKPFTSADVAWSILAVKQYHPRGRATLAQVREIQTPDAHTAILLLDKPAPYLLTALSSSEAPIVPRHLYEGKDVASNPHSNAPVGTGPFLFKEWVRGSHLVLERNPDYWDKPKPYVDRVIARFIPDASARAAALESGDIHIAGGGVAVSEIARFSKLPNLRVDTSASPYSSPYNQIIINHETPVLQDIRVRRAIAQAISVERIGKLAWYGQGVPSATAIGKSSRYHNASIPFYPFDPAAAEKLLDAAGHPRGADGKRFTLRLTTNPYTERRIADVIRQQLQKIGIDAVIHAHDFGTYVNRVYTKREFDLTVCAQSVTFDPTVGVQRLFWSKNFQIGLPFSNGGHYVNPEVDRLLEAAAVEPDEAKRRQLFAQFQKITWEDVAVINLGTPPETVIYHHKLIDAEPGAERTTGSFANLYFAP